MRVFAGSTAPEPRNCRAPPRVRPPSLCPGQAARQAARRAGRDSVWCARPAGRAIRDVRRTRTGGADRTPGSPAARIGLVPGQPPAGKKLRGSDDKFWAPPGHNSVGPCGVIRRPAGPSLLLGRHAERRPRPVEADAVSVVAVPIAGENARAGQNGSALPKWLAVANQNGNALPLCRLEMFHVEHPGPLKTKARFRNG